MADNKIPGLSGSPVIDSNGNLIGIMSQKAGKMERLSSIEYPKKIVKNIKSRENKCTERSNMFTRWIEV